MTFEIGSATVHDLASVATIERTAFSDPWSLRSFREALDSASVYFACARSDAGGVLGYVVAWFVADQGEIANIAVASDQRGRGVKPRRAASAPSTWRCATRINARASCTRREGSRK
jgi:ribosomal protein S18 acetylase RimI-like enzyme